MTLRRFKSRRSRGGVVGFFAKYSWLLGRNIIGWILILSSIPVGGLVPFPLGLPMFVIGFAMISFPGKRRLTARLLRGRPFDLTRRTLLLWITVVSLLIPPIFVWAVAAQKRHLIRPSQMSTAHLCALYLAAIATTWVAAFCVMWLLNLVIRMIPGMRRRVRPWLRRHGIKLLPPRRKRKLSIPRPRTATRSGNY
jgi:hypothetical protein